jgi:DNA-binding HxlR family transcriptional regulator
MAKLLEALGHEDRLSLVRELLEGARREVELRPVVPGLRPSTLTRHLDRLEAERLVVATGRRGDRRLAAPLETERLLQAAADLAEALARAQLGADRLRASELRKASFKREAPDVDESRPA